MTQASTSALQDATEAVNDAFVAAFAQGNAQALANTYTEDGEVLPTGSPEVHGREAIRQFWQAVLNMGVARAELTTRELVGMGENAYEVGQFKLYSANDELLDQGKYIVAWRQVNGEWLWHRDIFNSSQAAK